MRTALLLLAAAGGFAAAAAAWALVDCRLRQPPRWAVAAAVAAGVIAAVPVTTHATGWEPADVMGRVSAALIVGTAATLASPVLIAVVCAALAVIAGDGAALVVAGAAGAQLATVAVGGRSPLLGALSGSAVLGAALRLDHPDEPLLVATLGSLAVLAVTAGGVTCMRRRSLVLRGVAVAGLVLAAVIGLGAVSALSARPRLEHGIQLATAAVGDARDGDVAAARRRLEQASAAFASGRAALGRWWARPAWAVPVVGANLETAATMADIGEDIAAVGTTTLAGADIDLAIIDGKVPIEDLIALRAPLRRSSQALHAAQVTLERRLGPWLVAALARRRDELSDRVAGARRDADLASLAVQRLPDMLGSNGTRRYLLAVQNPAELRASGGIVASFGEIVAQDGRLRLERLGRPDALNAAGGRELRAPDDYVARYARFEPQTYWQNVSMSPDFPTVGTVIADLYRQADGPAVDGVIAVDPAALAALLDVIGPVAVPGLPERLTAANAERELLHDQYIRFPTSPGATERIDFLGEAARQVWRQLTNTALPAPPRLARAIGPAVAGRNLQITSFHPGEQALLERVGITGAVAPVDGDFLGVVTQNAGANKIDWFLHRSYRYDVQLDSVSGRIEATVHIELANQAPASGLPPYIIGPFLPMARPTEPGQNRLFLSIYTPWELAGATIGREPLLLESAEELDRRVYSAFVDIPAGTTAKIRLSLHGEYRPGAAYQLGVLRQPTIRPDDVMVSLRIEGRRPIAEASPEFQVSGATATAEFPVDRPRRLHAKPAGNRRRRST